MTSRHQEYLKDLKENGTEHKFISDTGLDCLCVRSQFLGFWIGNIYVQKNERTEKIDPKILKNGYKIHKYTSGNSYKFCFDCAGMSDYIPGDLPIAKRAGIPIPFDKTYKNLDFIKKKLNELSEELVKLI
jgi:hypothetical protein